MHRSLAALTAVALLLGSIPAFCHAGREFTIAYPAGHAEARVLAHLLGMVALDKLGFDVRILSLPAARLEATIASGDASLGIVSDPVPARSPGGWLPVSAGGADDPLLWGRYRLRAGALRLLVPERERTDLRFAAVDAVLGGALARTDLAFFTSLGTIPHAEGKLSGPLRTALEERGIL